MRTASLGALLLLVGLAGASQIRAEEITSGATTVNGSLTLVNDYVWRGQSQSWGGPALQFGIEADHESGAYAGFWTSNVSDQWVPGTRVETDWYAGVRGNLPAAWSAPAYELNLNYAYFPGGDFNKTGFALPASTPNTMELSAALTHHGLSLRSGTVLTKFYGWDTTNSSPGGFAGDPNAGVTGSTKGSYFIQADASREVAPGWSWSAQVGHQNIRHSTGLNWSYYKLGVSKTMDAWVAGLAYSASNEPKAFRNFLGLKNNGSIYSAARPAFILSLAHNF